MKVRSEYQNLIDHGEDVLPDHEAVNIRSKIELYSEYADIRDEYFDRPGDVNGSDKIRDLAKRYHYSVSSIEKIIWCSN